MTRINVVPPSSLTREHLIAEYRELPRVFALAHKASQSKKPWTDKQPKAFTMGTGHVVYWYDKLKYLSNRHKSLIQEMRKRGYQVNFTADLEEHWRPLIPADYWKDYSPTPEALAINQERIAKRLAGDKS